ncbi:MAG: hypothetical protein QF516_07670, partial [Pirellulaceae bacterium]|nr:hypothetical protein [Pirellulaceae bacterium]
RTALEPGSVVTAFSGAPYAACLLPAQQTRRCATCFIEASESIRLCVADRDVRMMECSSNTSLALEVFSGFERIFPRGVIDEFSVMSPC